MPPVNTLYTAVNAISMIEVEQHNMYKNLQHVGLPYYCSSRTSDLVW